MNKLRGIVGFVVSLCMPAQAHDFWLQPEHFKISPGASTPMTLQVGHGPFRQRSQIPLRRISRFSDIGIDGGVTDLRPSLHAGGATDDGMLTFKQAGTHVLLLETDSKAQSHLPALRFNDYLRVEGLTPALEERQRNKSLNAEGSENYSRCAKVIVQVGADAGGRVTSPVGLPLEIVPEMNPHAQPRSGRLPIVVLYFGKPLAGATVKLTNLDHDAEPFETRVSDSRGRADFGMPQSGRWMLNVIWTRARPRGSDTDFETVFSSLSFGFE
ncbi:DUF4198 domain-containing protein [Duganella sp. LjRoot269]|jgi:uncharacterized GH25 family protein|uniref:DUF4198 domain-containing protein n=1 Tax=Duganella sp. LjRoot269 TaxID=3342305 RepID=UPI003ED077D1